MKMSRVESRESGAAGISDARLSTLDPRQAFTLIEVMVVVVLMTFIIIALMSVFSGTQRAFRASLTQTDVLEGGRAAMDLITGDLRQMTPSLDVSNGTANFYVGVVNSTALVQPLTASGDSRTNILEYFFILSRENQTWTGTGYAVDLVSASPINPLYRYSTNMNVGAGSPWNLFNYFTNAVANHNFSGMSHLLDGVVDFRVRGFDPNGGWMNSNYTNANNFQTLSAASFYGETGFIMFSNTLPAAVEIQMGVVEDRTLQRAESLPNNLPAAPPNDSRTLYLENQASSVHVFRQRVTIPNLDPTAYQ
jgi:type II secretory pathway pseudopilin PulG